MDRSRVAMIGTIGLMAAMGMTGTMKLRDPNAETDEPEIKEIKIEESSERQIPANETRQQRRARERAELKATRRLLTDQKNRKRPLYHY